MPDANLEAHGVGSAVRDAERWIANAMIVPSSTSLWPAPKAGMIEPYALDLNA
jgi:hypothetical protein